MRQAYRKKCESVPELRSQAEGQTRSDHRHRRRPARHRRVCLRRQRGSGTSGTASKTGNEKTETAEQAVEYTEYSMTELMNDLENNAAAANDKYNGQYVILTGKLSNIDAQGNYISISDPDDDFAFTGCQCYIKGNEAIAETVKTLSKDDIISVKGKITSVGETLGYAMDIEEIITE